MSMLEQLNILLEPILPIETGVFSGVAPSEYVIVTPMIDSFELFADNNPRLEKQEVRLSLFTKGNYLTAKNKIVATLLSADFTITDRRYVGHEDDTGYYHYAIDVAKEFVYEGGD